MDRRIIPVGALVAGASFFLPYVQGSLWGNRITLTGLSLSGVAWGVPLLAGVILLGYALWDSPATRDVGRNIMLGGSTVGLALVVLGAYELFRARFLGISAWDAGFRPSVGPALTIGGFLAAFLGTLRLPAARIEARDAPSAAGDHAGETAHAWGPSPAATEAATRRVRQAGDALHALLSDGFRRGARWVRSLDLPARYRRHRRPIGVGGAAVVALAAVYLLFLRPSPEKVAYAVAQEGADCSAAYGSEVRRAEAEIVGRLEAAAFRTRGEAHATWNRMLEERRPAYSACVAAARDRFYGAERRFSGRRLERFRAAFHAQPRPAETLDVERTSQSAELLARIQAVRAPQPDEAEVRGHLLGHRVDGWNFDDPNEFREVRITTLHAGNDTLRLRVVADLVDRVSEEPYLAMLEVVYTAAVEGDWRLARVEPIVVAPHHFGYTRDDEVFIVGRWRWPANYALYQPDGTWAGRWDDGGERSGRWRIVRDRLTLTDGRSTWWSGRIHGWDAESMRLGDGTGVEVFRPGAPPVERGESGAPDEWARARRSRIEDPDRYTNVRAGPSVQAMVVARILEGEEFLALPGTSGWWRVRTTSGDSGYVHGSRVRALP